MSRAMPRPTVPGLYRLGQIGCLSLIVGCTNVSLPGLGTDPGNSTPVSATSAPPSPDARGVISFPTYQAVRAQRGDTVGSVAQRLGIDAEQLGVRNGLPVDAALREGELLLLPTRVASSSDSEDLASLASSALNRADSTAAPATAPGQSAATTDGAEPVRHKVARGETAYSIARLYNVSVRALADWNGLPSDYGVREGQVLLIPLARDGAPAQSAAADVPPGVGTPTPKPPSATAPLPAETLPPVAAATKPAAAPIAAPQTAASDTGTLTKPVEGRILRPYAKGKNDGVDFSASSGAVVRAAEGGTVAAITRDVDQVPIIVVRHPDNLLTVYANVDGISVAKGDTVQRGQQIAVVRAGDPSFLHFEVRQGFESVDPVDFLN